MEMHYAGCEHVRLYRLLREHECMVEILSCGAGQITCYECGGDWTILNLVQAHMCALHVKEQAKFLYLFDN